MRIAVGLGASIGRRRAALELALASLSSGPNIELLRTSKWYRTPPMNGGSARGWFVNGVALFACEIDPPTLLERCRRLERRMGRRRGQHWGDRPLDLDLLLAEGVISDDTDLTLPHPGIASRRFVLSPLLEVWPDALDPRTGLLWSQCPTPPGPRPAPIGVVAGRRAPLYQGESGVP